MHELMFQAGVKGMSERSELIPCIVHMYIDYVRCMHVLICLSDFPKQVVTVSQYIYNYLQ